MCCNGFDEDKNPKAKCACEQKKMEFVREARKLIGVIKEVVDGNDELVARIDVELGKLENTLKGLEGDDMK